MTANSVERNLAEQVRQLRLRVDDLARVRSAPLPNLRDLRDAELSQVQDGQVPIYDSATGRWKPLTPSSGIPASLVDAKGDLIVATADNTVTRLPVGADGKVLTADSTQTDGVKWASLGGSGIGQALQYPKIGEYLIPWNVGDLVNLTQNGNPVGTAGFAQIDVPVTMTFDRIGVRVAAAGSGAGYVYRLGIYPDDGTGQRPNAASAPTLDAGTISVTTAGAREITISQVLAPGRWWAVGVPQGTLGTAASLTSCPGVPIIPEVSLPAVTSNARRWRAVGVGAGALASTLTLDPESGWVPVMIGLRRSA